MSNKPNNIARLIETKTSGANEFVDKVLADLDSAEGKIYLQCKGINAGAVQKQYIEACLLGSNDLEAISKIIEIPVEIIRNYGLIFYDVAGLTKLEKLDLIHNSNLEPQELSLKLWAVNQGLEFLSWRLGGKTNIVPVEGLVELFSMAVFKSKEALFSGNSSESSKEATKWTKLSMDIARLLKLWQLDESAAKKDLELAIKEVVPEFRSISELLDEAKLFEAEQLIQESLDDNRTDE